MRKTLSEFGLEKKDAELMIEGLRIIRDTAWQFGRQHEEFGKLEQLAESLLLDLGVDDRPYPNPRPAGWYEPFIIEMYWEPTIPECGVWDRSTEHPDTYSEAEADKILAASKHRAYRKRRLEK